MLNTNILASYKNSERERVQTKNNPFSNETSGHGESQMRYPWSKGTYNPYDLRRSCRMDGRLGEK